MSNKLEIDLNEIENTIHNIYPEKEFNLNSGKKTFRNISRKSKRTTF
ncbi:MAG: hypothetical protein Ct9H90mP2_12490 [Dehalococcoidia bacterium]|nr:MAG: hypothetical protein Ct9H90mP2_12490 [Dehalococcoidia bacterium]